MVNSEKTPQEKYENSFAKIKNIIKSGNILCESDFTSKDEYNNFKTKFTKLQDQFYKKNENEEYDYSMPLFKPTSIEEEPQKKMEILFAEGISISSLIAQTPNLINKVCTTFEIKMHEGNNTTYCIDELTSNNKPPTNICATGGKKRRNKSRKTGKKHARRQNKRRSYKRNTKIW